MPRARLAAVGELDAGGFGGAQDLILGRTIHYVLFDWANELAILASSDGSLHGANTNSGEPRRAADVLSPIPSGGSVTTTVYS
jgi:hypothetical protein